MHLSSRHRQLWGLSGGLLLLLVPSLCTIGAGSFLSAALHWTFPLPSKPSYMASRLHPILRCTSLLKTGPFRCLSQCGLLFCTVFILWCLWRGTIGPFWCLPSNNFDLVFFVFLHASASVCQWTPPDVTHVNAAHVQVTLSPHKESYERKITWRTKTKYHSLATNKYTMRGSVKNSNAFLENSKRIWKITSEHARTRCNRIRYV